MTPAENVKLALARADARAAASKIRELFEERTELALSIREAEDECRIANARLTTLEAGLCRRYGPDAIREEAEV